MKNVVCFIRRNYNQGPNSYATVSSHIMLAITEAGRAPENLSGEAHLELAPVISHNSLQFMDFDGNVQVVDKEYNNMYPKWPEKNYFADKDQGILGLEEYTHHPWQDWCTDAGLPYP